MEEANATLWLEMKIFNISEWWGTECLNTRVPLPSPLCAGYSVKLLFFFRVKIEPTTCQAYNPTLVFSQILVLASNLKYNIYLPNRRQNLLNNVCYIVFLYDRMFFLFEKEICDGKIFFCWRTCQYPYCAALSNALL